MNTLSTLIATLALATAGAASAQAAPVSRDAVIADLVAARATGELAAIQGEKGIEPATPAAPKAAAVARAQLPRQAVLAVKPTELRAEERTATAHAADHGENAARELGDFPARVSRPTSALAAR